MGIEVSPWLKSLPVAPEYYPTLAEFQDPIAYIFKIEKEASKFGICKIIPPVPSAPRKTAIGNLNRSLVERAGGLGDPVFTTRMQQIGFCPRKHNRPVQKPVWESGESYTLGEFEAKAKLFEKGYLKKSWKKRGVSAHEIESVYWKATLDKPFSVEYANDMPGSAFVFRKEGCDGNVGNNVSVGETEWNMRCVSRAKGSLLRFMKEEIPGVTSPMVYIAMMFSWFAWHVEDHDLHSLNYLHTGAGKTWYGVPRDAAVAFEEVVRVHGYGGEINPIVTFSTLAQKTTVMSPEVFVNAGVPCCRLVQNPGEFVVTFPRAYHSGFSHGFNCGEASNIATPEWLMVAKDAAVRRASMNCPPMVSHFQLLYDLALSLCSRVPKNIHTEPRSARLKDKKKGEGDILVKDLFVHDVLQNNSLFHTIGKGSSVIVLPQMRPGSTLPGDSQLKVKVKLFPSLCNSDLVVKTMKDGISDSLTPSRHQDNHMTGANSVYDVDLSISSRADKVVSTLGSQSENMDAGRDGDPRSDRVSNQGLFYCTTCGILCFSSVAIVQPTETASQYLASGDCSRFSDCVGDDSLVAFDGKTTAFEANSGGLFDIPSRTADQNQPVDVNNSEICNTGMQKGTSSLGLLAMTYADCSDSEDDDAEADVPVGDTEIKTSDFISEGSGGWEHAEHSYKRSEGGENKSLDCCAEIKISSPLADSNCGRALYMSESTKSTSLIHSEREVKRVDPTRDDDSSRMHIFCLQHAVQVEKQLQAVGGSNVVLLCHPDYPMLEAEAKHAADELGKNNYWNDISYREVSLEDEEIIQSVLDSEESIEGNGDWAVKLGINLYYTANLSRSPLYSKQMPYNLMIYSAFGRKSEEDTSDDEKFLGRHRKVIVAGKWCGKVWTASQVHPMLIEGESEEQDHMRNSPTFKKPRLKIERSSDSLYTSFTTRKSCIKRKAAAVAREVVNAESPKADNSPYKVPERLHVNDSLEEVFECTRISVKRPKICSGNMKMRKGTFEPQISDKETDSDTVHAESPKMDDTPYEVSDNPQADDNSEDSPDEVFESPRLSVNWKISSRNMKMRKGNFEPQNSDMETDSHTEDELEGGPSTRLRRRTTKPTNELGRNITPTAKTRNRSGRMIKATAKSCNGPGRETETKPATKTQPKGRLAKKVPAIKEAVRTKKSSMRVEDEYQCNIESCTMSFVSKQELVLHKKNICPVKGCGKKFFSHKYLVQHRRVHMDDRPLKCPWKGCIMTFKWAWARTEHIRVHTGERPYVCTESGCGQTFRFVSDFSRHKRKTGHSPKKVKN